MLELGTNLSLIPSVGRSAQWVTYGKMADWTWMPFGVVSGVGRGMGVLDRGPHPPGERGGFGRI